MLKLVFLSIITFFSVCQSVGSRQRYVIEQILWTLSFIADDLTLGIGNATQSEQFLNDVLTDDFQYERSGLVLDKASFIGLLVNQLPQFFRGWHYLVGTPPLYEDLTPTFARIRINDIVASPQFLSGTDCEQDMTGEAVFWEFRRDCYSCHWRISKIENNVADNMNPIESTFTCPSPSPPAAHTNGGIFGMIDDKPLDTFVKKISNVSMKSGRMVLVSMFLMNLLFCSIVLCKLFCDSTKRKSSSLAYNKLRTISSESELE